MADDVGASAGGGWRKGIPQEWFSARAMYAYQLAVLREKSGMSLMELGKRCTYEQSYLHRLEKGERLGHVLVARTLDTVYGTGDLLERLWHLAKYEFHDRRLTGDMGPYEAKATNILEYAPTTLPELLRTSAYTRELLHLAQLGNEQTDQRIEALHDRQARLTSTRVRYRALIDEAALRRTARDTKTWTAQLEHLIEAAQWPGVVLHVVPLDAGPHHVRCPLELAYLHDGGAVASMQGGWRDHLTDDPEDIESLRGMLDALRDIALPPAASLTFLRALLDEHTAHADEPSKDVEP
ncbi:helix-turn-helix domain-containing protein [Actinacidiphila sp. bgisy144]|uniref:helix-turn-helix domain-containing protein n=1 Tax=Actinacidiphila sp. bgisy144 TaxID=3413791 RepID=UPI003EBE0974